MDRRLIRLAALGLAALATASPVLGRAPAVVLPAANRPPPNPVVPSGPQAAGLPSPLPFPAGLPPLQPVTGATTSPPVQPPPATSVFVGRPVVYAAGPGPHGPRGPFTPLQIVGSFLEADTNHDGELTRSEAAYLAIMPMSFEEMDRDGDGRISRFEYEDALGLR